MNDCFLGKLRSRAAGARIIIVNHHLFFADMKVKEGGFGEIIPRFQVAVFDEAHAVEEIAASYFGENISTRQLTDFAGEFERELKGKKERSQKKGNGAPEKHTGGNGNPEGDFSWIRKKRGDWKMTTFQE